MLKATSCEMGVFVCSVISVRKNKGRYCLELYLSDFDDRILIDIHDSLCEAVGFAHLTRKIIDKLSYQLPTELTVSNHRGYWRIQNEMQILSSALSKSLC